MSTTVLAIDDPTNSLLQRLVPTQTPLDSWPTDRAPQPDAGPTAVVGNIQRVLSRASRVLTALPNAWDDATLRSAGWNLFTLLARPSPQYDTGELIYPVEVRSVQSGASHYSASSAAGGLHTDGSLLRSPPDYAALLCLSEADEGGETVLVDVQGLRRHLEALDQSFYDVLEQPHPFAAPDDAGQVRQWAPIMSAHSDVSEMRYLRRYLEAGWARAAGPCLPGVTEAFDAVDAYITTTKHQRAFALRRGQMLIWRNAAFLHGRREFVERNHRRRLVRIYGERDPDRERALEAANG